MEEEMNVQGAAIQGLEEDAAPEKRRVGPTWRAWVVSILVAIALSVTATLLLDGSAAFQPEGGASGTGAGTCRAAACATDFGLLFTR